MPSIYDRGDQNCYVWGTTFQSWVTPLYIRPSRESQLSHITPLIKQIYFIGIKEAWLDGESYSVMSDSLQSHRLYSPWNSPGQNTEVGRLSLLQGIFPT